MSISENANIMYIIYVRNQEKSKEFYEEVLGYKPTLNVPGMTEFRLAHNVSLGIMPEEGIMRILENKIPDPKSANGIPRSEIYLFVDDPEKYYNKLVQAGGTGVSEKKLRNWGDYAAYGLDIDGHILAFAEKSKGIDT